jgi:hypothetical protein
VTLADVRRFELAERYWIIANTLWPMLEKRFLQAEQPLSGNALDAAKAALTLSHELAVAYKHLLAREARPRLLTGGGKNLPLLLQRSLEGMSRTIVTSYRAYSPVPAKTWLDVHRIYDFARERNLHQQPTYPEQPRSTLEQTYVCMLLLALANPYGLVPGQIDVVLRYLEQHAHWAKLTDVAPVHRMAKAVAIVPVGHDFPPFSANKGGTIEGRKIFLLTYDLAFQIQEQLRALEAGAELPAGIVRDRAARIAYLALLKRLLRQWAIPPARQFNRVPSRARVMACAGLDAVWQVTRTGGPHAESEVDTMGACQVINHTPAGYALRQSDPRTTPLRIGDVIALAVDGRRSRQVALVRWFRNTMNATALEFGCELLSDHPDAGLAAAEASAPGAAAGNVARVIVLPQDRKSKGPDGAPPQVIVPAHTFHVEQAITIKSGNTVRTAVLMKLMEQGPGYELYDFVVVD